VIGKEDLSTMGLLLRLARAWDQFWFKPGDPTTLGFVRLFCGFTVLYVHLAYTYDLRAFIGPNAWIDIQLMNEYRSEHPIIAPTVEWQEEVRPPVTDDPKEAEFIKKWGVSRNQAAAFGHHYWSIWYHVTNPTWMLVVHGGILVIMFLFAIGLCTRVTSLLTWVAMLSYIQRAPTALFGMDTIMIIVVLYLVIGPSGAAFSVGRLIERYWARRQALRKHQPVPDFSTPVPRVSANLALRLLQVHLCMIYLVSGLSKLRGDVWWNGMATWLTMANYEFSPMNLRIYDDFLVFIAKRRWLCELIITGGTYFTLAFEISFGFLIWNRYVRPFMIIAAVLLHAGIASFMGLTTFSMMMLVAVLSFMPGETIRLLCRRVRAAWESALQKQVSASNPNKLQKVLQPTSAP
jgi:hypothetical protein